MYRRGVGPTDPPVAAEMTSVVRSRDRAPTVTAMPTLTWSMMTTLADARLVAPILIVRGREAGSAVMPARYCAGGVPAGTATWKPRALLAPGPRVTVAGRPVTQHPAPGALPGGVSEAGQELAAGAAGGGASPSRR